MIFRNCYLIFTILLCLFGCDTSKKLQRSLSFSDTCLTSYQYFSDRIIREDDDLLEFIDPILDVYQDLLIEYEKNTSCWLGVLPEYAVVELFGTPHVRGVSHRNQEVTLLYYIRTEGCMSLEEVHNPDDKCGCLRFRFSKEGEPIGGIFYAFKAA